MNTSIIAVVMAFVVISLNHVEANVSTAERLAMDEYVRYFIVYRKAPTQENWAAVEAIKPSLPTNYITATMIVNNYTKATPNLLFSRVTGFNVPNQKEQGIDIENEFADIIGEVPAPAFIVRHALAGLKTTVGLNANGYNIACAFFSAKPVKKDAEDTQQAEGNPTNYIFIIWGKA